MNEVPVIICRQLSQSFQDGNHKVDVLKHIDFSINEGDRTAIIGSSGSGKSTLLHLLGGLDHPSEGQVFIQGKDCQTLSEKSLAALRNQQLGFVYQFHHLLPEMNCIENVAMPLLISGVSVKNSCDRAEALLVEVGLKHRLSHKHAQLSGGERQRVALARALVGKPKCLLADEPTGNLDEKTAFAMIDLMLALNDTCQTALVVVTHDLAIAARLDKHYCLTQHGLEETTLA